LTKADLLLRATITWNLSKSFNDALASLCAKRLAHEVCAHLSSMFASAQAFLTFFCLAPRGISITNFVSAILLKLSCCLSIPGPSTQALLLSITSKTTQSLP